MPDLFLTFFFMRYNFARSQFRPLLLLLLHFMHLNSQDLSITEINEEEEKTWNWIWLCSAWVLKVILRVTMNIFIQGIICTTYTKFNNMSRMVIKYCWSLSNVILNKTGVTNDPLGQIHYRPWLWVDLVDQQTDRLEHLHKNSVFVLLQWLFFFYE